MSLSIHDFIYFTADSLLCQVYPLVLTGDRHVSSATGHRRDKHLDAEVVIQLTNLLTSVTYDVTVQVRRNVKVNAYGNQLLQR